MTDRIAFSGTVETEGRRLRGSVKLAGERTFRNGEWVEVDPKVLMKADASKAFASWEHDDAKLLAAVPNGTLTITRTDQGFDWETAELPNTSYAEDALELVRGKWVQGTSFEIDGTRSSFSMDPDGLRVRRYSSIKTLLAVSPVRDPAFPSIAAAFSKESNVNESPAPEPQPEPPAPPEPQPEPAKFAEQPKSGADEWAAFARDISTEQIVAQMDGIFSAAKGDPTGDLLDRYEGFAKILDERKKADAQAKARAERMEAFHNLRLGRVPKAPEAGLYASEDYKQAFRNYLRTGDDAGMQQFAQSIAGDGTQGGYAVPDEFLNRIVESQKAYGGVQQLAEVITTSDGRPLRFPTNDDTANSAAIASEGSAVGSGGADKVFGSVDLGAYSYDATGTGNNPLLVSKELLQDAAFDIEAFIGRNLGQRIGRKMAADFATGSGSGEPKGLLDKTPDTMTATTLFAALVEHHFQVDVAYRGNASWVLSDTTLAKAYGSIDDNGRPLFIPQATSGGQGRPSGMLLGYPAVVDNDAGDLVAFGDINAGYIIRLVRGVQLDVDPYTNIKSRQVAYHAWARADANIKDAAAYSVSDYTSVNADS